MRKKLYCLSLLLWTMNGCGQIAPDLHNPKHQNENSDNSTNGDTQTNNGTHNIYDGHTIYDGTNTEKKSNSNSNENNSMMQETVTIDENSYEKEQYNNNSSSTKLVTNNSNSGNLKTYNSSLQGFRSIYFGFGEYGISSQMQDNMTNNIQTANNTTSKIKIEGNCDEFGTDEYNYALGLKRAKTVKDTLVSQGVDASQIVVTSYGESSPVCSEFSDSCYDRNRRVDIRLAQ